MDSTTQTPFNLSGKTALVTGCSRGIGLSIAIGLAKAGADIIGVSASLPLSGSDAEKEVTALGRQFKAYQCDFSDREAVKGFAAKVLAENEQIDILINNAGNILRSPAAEHPDEYWEKIIEINLNSQFYLSREIGRHMLENASGKIVFVASLLSFQGGITVPGYASSKHGIVGLTKALANEWSSKGVNVNAIAPGYIATDNTSALRDDENRSRQILERIPAGRWGQAEDLAGAAVFLSSQAASYIHGVVLPVDGGWLGR